MDVIDIAKYIANKCIDEHCPITNMQLQKILYFIQRDYLQRDEFAFYDDFEAWAFGPVVPRVFYHYCGFGAMPITIKNDVEDIDLCDKEEIDPIVVKKRTLMPWDLIKEAQPQNGAWKQAYSKRNKTIISKKSIRELG